MADNPAMTATAAQQLDSKSTLGTGHAKNQALDSARNNHHTLKERPVPNIASKHEKGWRRIVRNFSPSWFSVTMGTGIVSTILITIPWKAAWLYYLSIIFFVLNVALFSLALTASIVRYTIWPEIWQECNSMSASHQRSLDSITAAQLLPIAATIVAAGTGSEVSSILPDPQYALGTIIASYVMWGMAVPMSFSVLVMYYQRLALHKMPPREVIVSAFLPLGPLGFGGYAILYLGKMAAVVFPQTSTIDPLAGRIAYVLGFFIALIMWGWGLIWFAFALASIYMARPFPFNMGWWGFTFPLGVYSVSTILIGEELPSRFFRVLGTIFGTAVVLLWIVIAMGTAKGAWSGELFNAPCLANLEKKDPSPARSSSDEEKETESSSPSTAVAGETASLTRHDTREAPDIDRALSSPSSLAIILPYPSRSSFAPEPTEPSVIPPTPCSLIACPYRRFSAVCSPRSAFCSRPSSVCVGSVVVCAVPSWPPEVFWGRAACRSPSYLSLERAISTRREDKEGNMEKGDSILAAFAAGFCVHELRTGIRDGWTGDNAALMPQYNETEKHELQSSAIRQYARGTRPHALGQEHLPLVQSHELSHKSLQVENDFAARADPVLVECAPFHDISFQSIVDFRHELERESLKEHQYLSGERSLGQSYLQNGRRRYAMGQQVIQLRSYLQNPRRRSFLDDLRSNDFDQRLPVRWWNDCLFGYEITVWYQSTPKPPVTLHLTYLGQHARDLFLRRRRNSHQETSRANRSNDVARAICEQDQAQIRAVLLHRATERGLRIARKLVRLIDHHDLEPLFRSEIDLLSLRDLFQQVLDHNAVVIADIRGRDLQVVVGRHDVEFEFAIRGRLKNPAVDLDLLNSRAIQGA
nr:sulfite efflux pump ssu1 [Quercus suber]